MTIDFICEELAELFDSPCNYSPMDEKMFQDSYCESHCGKITDKECWKQYFEKVWADRKTEPQTDNSIGCSKCESRFWCMDRDMPHAVHCNNYGKVTDEPQFDKDINVRSKYKQGTWLYGDGVYCSCCGYKLETTALLAKCPKCGADMSKTDCAWK